MEEGVRSPWSSVRAGMESRGREERASSPCREGGKGANHPKSGWAGLAVPLLASPLFQGLPTSHAQVMHHYFPRFSPHDQAEAGHSSHLLPAGVGSCSKVTEFLRIVEQQFHCRLQIINNYFPA